MLMAADHVLIGFRIELWDSGRLIASALCEGAFLAAALPRPGDLVASRIVGGITLPRWVPGPFMEVTAVEHYPAKPPDQPGVQVVIRQEARRVSMDELRPLEAFGWIVELFPGTPG
jgi:hypothetical protein